MARLEAARAEQVSGFLKDLFREASPAKNFGKPMNALELLNTGAREISAELSTQPELRAALATTIGESYLTMRENKTARDFLAPIVPVIRQQLGARSPLFLRLQSEYGAAIMHAGDTPAGREILADNLAGWEAVSPEGVSAGIAHRRLGTASRLLNQYDEAEIHYKEAIRIFRNTSRAPAGLLTDTLMGYGVLLRNRNQFDAEETLLKEALDIQARCCGERQVDFASLVNNLGRNYSVRGWIDKAEREFRRHADLQKVLVGENGVAYGNALMNLANSLVQKGDYDGALSMQLQGREIYGRGYGEDSIPYAYVTENIASGLMRLKRYDEARVEFLEAMGVIENVFGVEHVEYAFTQSNYGNMLVRAGALDEGIDNLEASHDVFVKDYGAENASTIISHTKLAAALMEKKDAAGAREHALAAVEAAKRTWPDPHPATQDALESLARTYRMSEDYDAAREVHAEAIVHANSIDGQPLNLIVKAEVALARTLIAEGNRAAAQALLMQKREQIADLDSDWDSTRESIDKLLASD